MFKSVVCVIVTYNGSRWIKKCIESIKEDGINLKIIVIDNNSNDDTISIIKQYFPEATLIESKENLGFGKANNIGYEMAIAENADYVYLLNQDTVSYPDNIAKLITVTEEDSKIGVVSPIHLNDDGKKLDINFEEYITAVTCPNYISDITLNNVKAYYEIGFVNAAAWLIKTEKVQYLGGLFSKAFYHYGEDVNFIGRLRYFNFKNVIVPNVFIHHCREERKGRHSKAFINKLISINMITMMHDIKLSYLNCYKQVLKYALQQLTSFHFINFFKLVTYPILNYSTISSYRKSYINRKLIS